MCTLLDDDEQQVPSKVVAGQHEARQGTEDGEEPLSKQRKGKRSGDDFNQEHVGHGHDARDGWQRARACTRAYKVPAEPEESKKEELTAN